MTMSSTENQFLIYLLFNYGTKIIAEIGEGPLAYRVRYLMLLQLSSAGNPAD